MLRKFGAVLLLISGIIVSSALDSALGVGGVVAFLGGLLSGAVSAEIWLSA